MSEQKKSWREVFPVHPVADVFPRLSENELRELGEDIKKNGLHHPIVTWSPAAPEYKDQPVYVLDGRNRLDAMELVEMETFYESPDSPGGYHIRAGRNSLVNDQEHRHSIDPAVYVLSANIHRRHLTKAEQADLIVQAVKAAEGLEYELGEKSAVKDYGGSIRQVSEIVNNTTDFAKIARSVKREAASGRLSGSAKDSFKAKVIEHAAEAGISKRTAENAIGRDRGPVQEPRQQAEPPPITDIPNLAVDRIARDSITYLERKFRALKRSDIAQILTAVVDHFQETHGRGFSLLKDKRVDA